LFMDNLEAKCKRPHNPNISSFILFPLPRAKWTMNKCSELILGKIPMPQKSSIAAPSKNPIGVSSKKTRLRMYSILSTSQSLVSSLIERRIYVNILESFLCQFSNNNLFMYFQMPQITRKRICRIFGYW
jgi:hypothetical protein